MLPKWGSLCTGSWVAAALNGAFLPPDTTWLVPLPWLTHLLYELRSGPWAPRTVAVTGGQLDGLGGSFLPFPRMDVRATQACARLKPPVSVVLDRMSNRVKNIT